MKKQPRERDPSFLRIAAFAGVGGVLALASGIGLPTWQWLHHNPVSPAFFFFCVWGLVALAGCGASIATYRASGDPPRKPPHGGIPAPKLQLIEGRGQQGEAPSERDRRAA